MDSNELIERYIHEVGRALPSGSRNDIEMELRSLLQDSLEERAAETGKAPTVRMTAELLREFGAPAEMAARYRPEQSLIGPQLFPIYKQVLTVVLVIIGVLHVAGLVFVVLQGETAVFGRVGWGWLTNFVQTAVFNAGLVTLIFAAVERTDIVDAVNQSKSDSEWEPLELPPVKDPERVNRFELGFGMLWTAAFLILFNFYQDVIGVTLSSADGEQVFYPLLSAEFMVHVPWLSAVWVYDLVMRSIVLVRGKWTPLTRWLEVGYVGLTIHVLNRIRVGGEIFTFGALTTVVKLTLLLVIVILAVDGLFKIFSLLTKRPISLKSRFA